MQRGFMLIEVLIASLISAILGAILFSAYYQSNRITRSIDDFIDVYSKEALLQHQLEKDLSGAFIPSQARAKETPIENIFVSSNQDGRLNRLSFITNNPLTTYGGGKPRIVRVVYNIKAEEIDRFANQKESYLLTRQESTNLDLKAFSSSDAPDAKSIRSYVVAEGIKDFRVEYASVVQKDDKVELDKKDTWRSESKEEKTDDAESDDKKIMLPQIATFSIALWDSKQERDRSFIVQVPIFAGGFDQDQLKKKMKTKQTAAPNKKKETQAVVNGKPGGNKRVLEKQTVVVEGGKPPVVVERKVVQVPA